MDYDKLDADTRSGTVDALAEATALHLRMLGRWQPGTIRALLRCERSCMECGEPMAEGHTWCRSCDAGRGGAK